MEINPQNQSKINEELKTEISLIENREEDENKKGIELNELQDKIYDISEDLEPDVIEKIKVEFPEVKFIVGFDASVIREAIWFLVDKSPQHDLDSINVKEEIFKFFLNIAKEGTKNQKRFLSRGILTISSREIVNDIIIPSVGENTKNKDDKIRLFRVMKVLALGGLSAEKTNHGEVFMSLFPEKDYGNYIYEFEIKLSKLSKVMGSGNQNVYFASKDKILDYKVYPFVKNLK